MANEVCIMKDLSIIIPVYNCADSLGRLLESLVGQKQDAVGIIVVDDGSTDDSLHVARQYEQQGVTVLHQENGGVGAARNAGLAQCDARYVWFVDADDEVEDGAIETITAWIGIYSCDCYYFGFRKISGTHVEAVTNAETMMLRSYKESAEHFDDLFCHNLLNPLWNKVFRKDVIDERRLQFSNLKAGEDAIFVLDFLRYADSMYVATDVLYAYVVRSASSSARRYNPEYAEEQMKMFHAFDLYERGTHARAARMKQQWRRRGILGCCSNLYAASNGLCDYYGNLRRALPDIKRMLAVLERDGGKAGTPWWTTLDIVMLATLLYVKKKVEQ